MENDKIGIHLMIWFWVKYLFIILTFGIMSVISYIIFPLAYFFRVKLDLDILWVFLNDETLSGEQWWLDKYNLNPDSFWTKWRWNIRNSAWNYKLLFKPKWDMGDIQAKKTIKNTIGPFFAWANRSNGPYGFNFCFYIMRHSIHSRFSYATSKVEFQAGSAGNRYKLRIKPVSIPILFVIIIGSLIYYFNWF